MPPNRVVYPRKPVSNFPLLQAQTYSPSSPPLWWFIYSFHSISQQCGSGLCITTGILIEGRREWVGSILGKSGTTWNLRRGQARNRTERECLKQHENTRFLQRPWDVEDATQSKVGEAKCNHLLINFA